MINEMKERKNNLFKRTIRLTILFFNVFLTMVLLTTGLIVKAAPTHISITYNPGSNATGSQIVKSTEYDARLYSALLVDFGTSGTENWSIGKINGTYGDGTQSAEYTAAFAGWKLTKVNGNTYNGTVYFYPDNDFVYTNDKPFTSYATITSLEFEALWGKTVYLRDRYDFKDITNVFGAVEADMDLSKGASLGTMHSKINYGIIDWDTSKEVASDNYSGSTSDKPVASMAKAEELLGTAGGKIVVVNHYTIEAAPELMPQLGYEYYSSDALANGAANGVGKVLNYGTYDYKIGTNIKNGTLTITGENYGMANELEKVNDTVADKNTVYQDAHIYINNNRGNGLVYANKDKTSYTAYQSLFLHLYFDTNTVLEHFNLVGYREKWNTNGGRMTSDVYLKSAQGKRFVLEDSLMNYQRTTDSGKCGVDTTNWGHSPRTLHGVTMGRLTPGGGGWLHIYAGFGYSNPTAYITIRGKNRQNYVDFWLVYLASVGIWHTDIHAYIEGISTSREVAVFDGRANKKGNFIGINFYNYNGRFETMYGTGTCSAKIKQLTIVVEGTGRGALHNAYIGGYSDATQGQIMAVNIDRTDFYVDSGIVGNIYGGGNSLVCQSTGGDYHYYVNGGTVTAIYGGGLGGYIGSADSPAKIDININGGTIENIYGGGSGGAITLFQLDSPAQSDFAPNFQTDSEYNYGYDKGSSLVSHGPFFRIDKEKTNLYEKKESSFRIATYTVGGAEYQAILYDTMYSQNYTNYGNYSNYYLTRRGYAISDAAVYADIDIDMTGGTVNQDITGGGKNGSVTGNIDIDITGGIVKGNVYGGGEGRTSEFLIYAPNSKTNPTNVTEGALRFRITATTGYDSASFDEYIKSNSSFDYHKMVDFAESIGQDPTKVNTYFIRNDVPTITEWNVKSTTISKLGKIKGNTNILVDGGTINGSVFGGSDGIVGSIEGNTYVAVSGGKIDGNVYGGGNNGAVTGNTVVDINEGANISKAVFGGGNGDALDNQTNLKGAVNGNATLNINAGTIYEAFGGCNAADVTGDVTLNISGGTTKFAFGANNEKGTIKGSVNTTLSGGIVEEQLFAGGNKANYQGIPNLTISGGNVGVPGTPQNPSGTVSGCAFGGAKEAIVEGTNVLITGGNLRAFVGGSYMADIVPTENQENAIYVKMTGGTITTFLGSNDVGGNVSGNIRLIIGDETTKNLNDAIKITNFFGGGNNADYTYGSDWQHRDPELKQDLPIDDFKGITISIYNGDIFQAFGGGVMASISNMRMTVHGGEFNFLYGGGYKGSSGNTAIHVKGGTYDGDWIKYDQETDPSATQGGYIFSGGYEGYVQNAHIHIEDESVHVEHSVFGGGFKANAGDVDVVVRAGVIRGSVYGGGYNGNVGVDASGNIIIDSEATVELFGGHIGELVGGSGDYSYVGNVYGGGYRGTAYRTHIEIIELGYTSYTEKLYLGGNVYGGGHEGEVLNNTYVHFIKGEIKGNIYGGGRNGNVVGQADIMLLSGTLHGNAYGGGLEGNVESTLILISDNLAHLEAVRPEIVEKIRIHIGDYEITQEDFDIELLGNVYGGGYAGYVDSTYIALDFGNIENNIYGGGYQGDVRETLINIIGGTIKGSVYGGGQEGNVIEITNVNFYAGQIQENIYGGGYQGNVTDSNIIITGGTIKNVYGGGYQGNVEETIVNINGSIVYESVYGGGQNGDVTTKTYVKVENGEIGKNIYGGGLQGNVNGSTEVVVNKGLIDGNVYGGGYAGTVNDTNVLIEDNLGTIHIRGDVFGGGYGDTATILGTTKVVINLKYSFEAEEQKITLGTITPSGQISTAIKENPGSYSVIEGSVYGGGDLGQVGDGFINQSNNTARVTVVGNTDVTVINGHILGHVFGGGNGVPKEGDSYNVYMGTVFGSTITKIYGGYIEGNIYGGGKQSRVYDDDDTLACHVIVDETVHSQKIAIGGSIFGGGDRGNGATTNASVPTVVGNVTVDIIGALVKSQIYFVTTETDGGGVYGDGNLCLVKGYRTINITNLTTGDYSTLKTFYSLQRADVVNLNNAEIVLLGAIDLVEEGDDTVYSINRINHIYMNNGSIIKLDQIVKYLGAVTSDVFTDRVFIDKGNNGKNNYTTLGGSIPNGSLTDEDVDSYRNNTMKENGTAISKNIICVANGLYFEVSNDQGEYGPIIGLYTLQLLHAEPGEGGGFVYANVITSTGEFICETTRGLIYQAVPNLTPDEYNSGTYYIREPGKGYVEATGEYSSEVIYYLAEYSYAYMDIIDDVGGIFGTNKAYYFWYINGPTIHYTSVVIGYIGADENSFEDVKTIPQHEEEINYVLFSIEGNETLKDAIKNNYILRQSSNLTGQQIAVEFIIGNESIGFLYYDETNDKWSIQLHNGNLVSGYLGSTSLIEQNVVLTNTILNSENDDIRIVLHKSKEVNAEIEDMGVIVEFDLFDNEYKPYTKGTSTLSFDIIVHIIRLVPKQNMYTAAVKGFTGASGLEILNITSNSSFTVEYQTKYIPSAYPISGNTKLEWKLTTYGYSYYMDKLGNYLTLDQNGNSIYQSSTIIYDPTNINQTDLPENNVYKKDGKYYYKTTTEVGLEEIHLEEVYSTPTSIIHAGTKITLIDYTGDVPTYYYYIVGSDVTEISLYDFYLMGTKTKMKDSKESEKPEFVKQYEEGKTSRLNERLIFIFDLMDVNWDNNVETCNVMLQHLYNGLDIMDYVDAEIVNNATIYTRSNPVSASYTVNNEVDGLDETSWNVGFTEESTNPTYFDIDDIEINASYEQDKIWTNTLFSEGEYSLKIELLKDSLLQEFPTGAEVVFEGNTYHPGMNRGYIVVPLKDTGEHTFTFRNTLYSLKEVIGEKVTFKLTLYSSPDANYYNSLSTTHVQYIEYQIIDNPKYSVNVTTTNTDLLYQAADRINVIIDSTSINEVETPLLTYISLEQKNENNIFVETAWNNLFVEETISSLPKGNHNLTLTLKDQLTSGSYRIKVKYGDQTEYFDFVID